MCYYEKPSGSLVATLQYVFMVEINTKNTTLPDNNMDKLMKYLVTCM